jgi:N utilization substance protein B
MTNNPSKIDYRRMARGMALHVLYELATTSHSKADSMSYQEASVRQWETARMQAYLALRAYYEESDMPTDSDGNLIAPTAHLMPLEEQKMAHRIVEGVLENKAALETILKRYIERSLDALSIIDHVILQIAVFEFVMNRVPLPVAINEATELAKIYSDEESFSFVNGLLGGMQGDVAGLREEFRREED